METLAKEAGVSNPLIYKYFDTRLALLQELLSREFNRFYGEMQRRIDKAGGYEKVVTIVVAVNFEQIAKRGLYARGEKLAARLVEITRVVE